MRAGKYSLLNHSDEDENLPLNTNESLPSPQEVFKASEATEEDPLMPMSFKRKVCFVFSILLCFVYIIVIGALLPCATPTKTTKIEKLWSTSLDNYTISTNLALYSHDDLQIILGYKNGGLLSFTDPKGRLYWKNQVNGTPLFIDCSSLSISRKNVLGCLVSGEGSLLSLINPNRGNFLWSLSPNDLPQYSQIKVNVLPSVIPDCDEDDAPEIALFLENENSSLSLSLISSTTGKVLGTPLPIPFCDASSYQTLFSQNSNGSVFIVGYCSSYNGSIWGMPSEELCNKTFSGGSLIYKTIYKFGWDAQLFRISSTDMLLLSSDGQTLAYFSELKLKWETKLEPSIIVKKVVSGHFVTGHDLVLALLSNSPSGPMLMLLSIKDGAILDSYVKHNAVNIERMHLSENSDGLLLETHSKNLETTLSVHLTVKYQVLKEKNTFDIYSFRHIIPCEKNSSCANMSSVSLMSAKIWSLCNYISIVEPDFVQPRKLVHFTLCNLNF